MREYVNFADIEDICSTMRTEYDTLANEYKEIENAFNSVGSYWEGAAARSFADSIKSVTKNFEAADEVIYSILFLASVGEGYENLTNSSAQNLINIVNQGTDNNATALNQLIEMGNKEGN